tara:strand:+ start:616 stop:846 length:231 start_codon:yes stop_codon:yes gene_type:complete
MDNDIIKLQNEVERLTRDNEELRMVLKGEKSMNRSLKLDIETKQVALEQILKMNDELLQRNANLRFTINDIVATKS